MCLKNQRISLFLLGKQFEITKGNEFHYPHFTYDTNECKVLMSQMSQWVMSQWLNESDLKK